MKSYEIGCGFPGVPLNVAQTIRNFHDPKISQELHKEDS